MEQLIKTVIKRLEGKDIDINSIPSFIRDVVNINLSVVDSDLNELNRRLQTLGWYEFELDDHTFQLIKAIIESERFINKEEEKEGLLPKEFSIPLLFHQSRQTHSI